MSPTNSSMNEFIENILKTLNSNGFPEKRVSLPTERMYEAADNKGLSFNQVLDQLKVEHNIEAQIGADKIIFSKINAGMPFAGMDQEDIMKQAQEMMSQMDPEEMKKLQDMFKNMSAEEREGILKKGKDLGII
jgi:hypothetical protein